VDENTGPLSRYKAESVGRLEEDQMSVSIGGEEGSFDLKGENPFDLEEVEKYRRGTFFYCYLRIGI